MANKVYSLAKLLMVASLFVLELLDMTVSAKKAQYLHNVHCEAYETVVPVDPTGHEYYPLFVKLHRCAGSVSTVVSPNVQHCVAKTYDELNIQAFSLSAERAVTIMMKNHTSCTNACVVASPDDCDFSVQDWDDDLCACKCRYPTGPPKELACKDGFRWNNHKCRCECDRAPDHCPLDQVWSNDICGCRCETSVVDECTQRKMGIDVNCQCVDVLAFRERKGDYTRTHMFITLLIGQAVLIILLICALVHWVRKRKSAHSPLDRLDSCKTEDDVPSPYLEVAVESDSSESLEGAKDSSYNDSCTAPLSIKERVTDI
ncbi:hypothetical protein OS493_009334 [Desmophyllum pertusum]|uniref:Uncharacterized protein n=1 Tax=Desmophyllum pertusum TaxID=174260 RepID=A0A9X0CSM3_9CNID|nr:hypothetical protein OS493_009334 [Desmophyllum pertusum]